MAAVCCAATRRSATRWRRRDMGSRLIGVGNTFAPSPAQAGEGALDCKDSAAAPAVARWARRVVLRAGLWRPCHREAGGCIGHFDDARKTGRGSDGQWLARRHGWLHFVRHDSGIEQDGLTGFHHRDHFAGLDHGAFGWRISSSVPEAGTGISRMTLSVSRSTRFRRAQADHPPACAKPAACRWRRTRRAGGRARQVHGFFPVHRAAGRRVRPGDGSVTRCRRSRCGTPGVAETHAARCAVIQVVQGLGPTPWFIGSSCAQMSFSALG